MNLYQLKQGDLFLIEGCEAFGTLRFDRMDGMFGKVHLAHESSAEAPLLLSCGTPVIFQPALVLTQAG